MLATSDTSSQVNTEKVFAKALEENNIPDLTLTTDEKARIARKTYEVQEQKSPAETEIEFVLN